MGIPSLGSFLTIIETIERNLSQLMGLEVITIFAGGWCKSPCIRTSETWLNDYFFLHLIVPKSCYNYRHSGICRRKYG